MTSIAIGAVYNFGASDNTSRSCQDVSLSFVACRLKIYHGNRGVCFN
jgi:hypothetical protein